MTKRILFIDDDAEVLASLKFQLGSRFEIETANGAEYGIKAVLTNGPYAVVVSDLRMPHVDGVRFLTWLETKCPDTVRILLTAYADLTTSISAINEGHVFRFLTKPSSTKDLIKALEDGLRQYELVESEHNLLQETLSGSVRLLTELLAMMDEVSFGRAEKTRDYVRAFASAEQIEQSWELEVAAMLSRIGFITMPDTILQKVGGGVALAGVEEAMFNRIPQIGYDLLANIPRLQNVARIVLYHQKHFDGTGPPTDNIANEKIPYEARVLKVFSDIVDLESSGLSRTEAVQRMSERAAWYDPHIMKKLETLPDFQQTAESSGRVSRVIPYKVGDLRPGLVLHSTVETVRGLRLLSAGVTISAPMLEKIRNHAELTGIKEPVEIVNR